MSAAVFETKFPDLKLHARGKVRDVYDLGDKVLIGLSRFWFDFLANMPRNHLITTDVKEMGYGLDKYHETLAGRSMLVVKADVFPVECVVRGYLMGSGWKEYQEKSSVCGIT